MLKKLTGAVCGGICCCFLISGCSRASDEAIPSPDSPLGTVNGVAVAPFVSQKEFCRARLIHVATRVQKTFSSGGSCYIEDRTMTPVVGSILKRALKAYNLQVSSDKNSANYILDVSFDQRYIRRRTYTTLKLVFSENKKDNPLLWVGAATVNGRGSYPVNLYAASMTGAVMYNFNQYAAKNVDRRTLQSYYRQLASIGD